MDNFDKNQNFGEELDTAATAQNELKEEPLTDNLSIKTEQTQVESLILSQAEEEENLGEVKTKKKKRVSLINVILIILIVILILRLIFNFFFSGIYIVGDSMLSTIIGAESADLPGGDYLYINKYSEPDYGDIVVVDSGEKDEYGKTKVIIKRVIALDGDSVYLQNGKLYLKKYGEEDFSLIVEDYVDVERNLNLSYNTTSEYHVEGMFLLGDNRDGSKDSRSYGCFSYDNLYGVVTEWSLTLKQPISAVFNFFKFTLNFNI